MNNLSETAFISIQESKDNNFVIRYFTPMEELDICGHAALASLIYWFVRRLKGNEFYHSTKAGSLKVVKREGIFYIEMKKPEIVGYASIDEILDITSLKEEEIIPDAMEGYPLFQRGLKMHN